MQNSKNIYHGLLNKRFIMINMYLENVQHFIQLRFFILMFASHNTWKITVTYTQCSPQNIRKTPTDLQNSNRYEHFSYDWDNRGEVTFISVLQEGPLMYRDGPKYPARLIACCTVEICKLLHSSTHTFIYLRMILNSAYLGFPNCLLN